MLLIPASLCLAFSLEAKLESDFVAVLTAPVVAAAEQVCAEAREAECADRVAEAVVVDETPGGRGDDQLGMLRAHLDAMGRSLQQTGKTVDEMARQRDAARAEAAQHQQNHTAAMEELARLRDELQAARAEGAEWKKMAASLRDKVEAGAVARAEMEKFRGELHGAMKEFQAMKNDFSKAREELRDPIERTALKKAVADLEAARKHLTHEVEVALQAKGKVAKDLEDVKGALKEAKDLARMRAEETQKLAGSLEEMRAAHATAMADVTALQEEAGAERERQAAVTKERDELRRSLEETSRAAQEATRDAGEARKRMAALEQKEAETGKELAALRGHLGRLEAEVNGKEQALAEAVKLAQAAKEEQASMARQLTEAQAGLVAREKELGGLGAEMKKLQESVKQAEAGKRGADEELQRLRAGLHKAEERLAIVTKAKSGVEDLFFKKTAEVVELKTELRKVQAQVAEERRNDEKPAEVANATGE